MIKTVTVSWFSAGVNSAVTTKLMLREIDVILYQHIDDMEQVGPPLREPSDYRPFHRQARGGPE